MNSWQQHFTLKSDTNIRTRLAKINNSPRFLQTSQHKLLNFVSNDYLGLSMHPKIIAQLKAASDNYGVGSTGAPSLSGYSLEHQYLAQELATWLNYTQVLLFNSGYQLNISLISQLVDKDTQLWIDRNIHASHLDGLLLARAKFTSFNAQTVTTAISKIKAKPQLKYLILTEGVFSMDGNCTYLTELFALKQAMPEQILLIVDDAHGIGAYGDNGHGLIASHNLANVDILIGTFGKAFATHGGFLATSDTIAKYLEQTVRSQIYSTMLPPAIAAASRCALTVIQSPEGRTLRQKLQQNIQYFHECAKQLGLNIFNSTTNNSAIQLLIYPQVAQMQLAHQQLLKQNLLVGKISYPSVAKDAPRLRISLNSAHSTQDINQLLNAIYSLGNSYA